MHALALSPANPERVARPRFSRKGRQTVSTAAPLIPDHPTLQRLRHAARTCQACPLWARALQTVFGEGSPDAKVLFVGEQPRFEEDRAGHPFVGPAGRLLDKALEQAAIDRSEVYVTNVVKHFKWEPKGQQHIHKNPTVKRSPPACRGCRPNWRCSSPKCWSV